MHKVVRCALALGLAVGASCGAALAQSSGEQVPPQELKKIDPAPSAASKSPSEQAGTREPTTDGAGTGTKAEVFHNGSLAVPGAPTDTETAPAKFSERNAASDRLPTAAFRLKPLSAEQRHEIYRQLTAHRGSLALSPGVVDKPQAKVGAAVPTDVALGGLTAVPEAVAEQFPALRGTAFMQSGSDVLIVDTLNRQVIGVLSAP